MKEKFELMIDGLRNRRLMIVSDTSYISLTNFLTGYDLGLRDSVGRSLLSEFQKWLRVKVNHHFSLSWSAYILHEMALGDEVVAQNMLFELLTEFLKKRE